MGEREGGREEGERKGGRKQERGGRKGGEREEGGKRERGGSAIWWQVAPWAHPPWPDREAYLSITCEGRPGHFQVWATMRKPAINTCVRVFS